MRMNNILLLLCAFTMIGRFAFGQEISKDSTSLNQDSIYFSADVMPEPVGGFDVFFDSLILEIEYPKDDREQRITGTVWVQFVVEKDGTLSEIKVVSDKKHLSTKEMQDEVLRIMQLAQRWKPGSKNGVPVRMRYMIPVNFVID